MKYEIRSRKTEKVIYDAYAEDVAKDWNFKKKMLVTGRDKNKKLMAHINKYGVPDLYLTFPEKKIIPEKKENTYIPTGKKRGRKKINN